MRDFRFAALVAILLGTWAIDSGGQQPSGQPIQFNLASQHVIEDRLRAYVRKNSEREPALRRLFEDADCRGDALFEQQVKGERAPNLVCTSPGSTESVIVVEAHSDLVEWGEPLS